MKRLLLVALLIIPVLFANAQVFEGAVKDAKTNLPLPYVNVGIIGKSVGTVTDSAGHYKINLGGHEADSLKLSMIGYAAQIYKVSAFESSNKQTILLQPSVIELKEVKVSNRTLTESVFGNTTQSRSMSSGFNTNTLGNEIGAIIKVKQSPTYLKQFNASLASEVTTSLKLRLNFYSVKNGLPDKVLQQQNIYITVIKGQDIITVHLEPYYITVEDRFFVSLEWIKDEPGNGLMFSANLFNSPIISRETSQAKWKKMNAAGIGFNVLAEY